MSHSFKIHKACIIYLFLAMMVSCNKEEEKNIDPEVEKNENNQITWDLMSKNKKYSAKIFFVDDQGNKQSTDSDIQMVYIFKKDNNSYIRLKWKELFDLWSSDDEFLEFFIEILKSSKISQYYIECIPYDNDDVEFEFVLYKTTRTLTDTANGSRFSSKTGIKTPGKAISFDSNTGNHLVVPSNSTLNGTQFAHIANFVRQASISQQKELWKKVSEEFRTKHTKRHTTSNKPLKCLSTLGHDVPWLHVRIDYGKYYHFVPYKNKI